MKSKIGIFAGQRQGPVGRGPITYKSTNSRDMFNIYQEPNNPEPISVLGEHPSRDEDDTGMVSRRKHEWYDGMAYGSLDMRTNSPLR